MQIMQPRIESLAKTVFSHPALNNDFYRRWMAGPLTLDEVEIFARNYLARTANTSTMVALSFLCTQDIAAKVEIAKNLHSEFGNGNLEKAHIVLLESFLCDLLSRLAKRPYSLKELQRLPVLATTEEFIREQRSLYTDDGRNSNPRHVLGTLLAQEWLAYSMLTRLYEGVRNYQAWYASNDDFHEHCEYFYVHIGDAEKEHKQQAVKAAMQECASDRDLVELSESFNSFLDITARYWNGISMAMSPSRANLAFA